VTENIFRAFLGTLADIPKGSIMDHHHYASPMISPTAHFALNTAVRGKDTLDWTIIFGSK